MRKIAVVCNSLNPDMVRYFEAKVYGAKNRENVVFLANRSIAKKHSLPISSISPKASFSFYFFIDGLISFEVFIRLIFLRVRTIIFDTAHISNLPLAILANLAGMKLIFTIHDWDPHPGEQSKFVLIYNEFVKKVLADEFIVLSPVEATKTAHVLKLSGFEKARCLEPSNYFLFFGRIEPYKGLCYLYEIAKYLDKLNSDLKIIVAGKGDDPWIDKLNELKNIEMNNYFISEGQLDDLISSALGALLPYDSATQSSVIVQTYSHSKPVVIYDIGFLSLYVRNGKTGDIVPHRDIELFAKAMLNISANYNEYVNYVGEEFDMNYGIKAAGDQFNKFLDEKT